VLQYSQLPNNRDRLGQRQLDRHAREDNRPEAHPWTVPDRARICITRPAREGVRRNAPAWRRRKGVRRETSRDLQGEHTRIVMLHLSCILREDQVSPYDCTSDAMTKRQGDWPLSGPLRTSRTFTSRLSLINNIIGNKRYPGLDQH
jgi:hypothetical protein